MFRIAFCLGLLASVIANRIQSHHVKSTDVANSRATFGASCEDLQSTFHSRVGGLQSLLDAHPDDSTFNAVTQARFTVRTLGVARVLRRARTCSWVVDGNSDDIEQMRGIVQVMLAGNPCAQAARAELEAGASDDSTIEMIAVRRAMSILVSENCEAALSREGDAPTLNLDNDAELETQIEAAEEQAQERVDEFVDASMGEESNGAFVETSFTSDQVYGGIFRTLGVVFLFLLLLLACTSAVAVIGALIATVYAEIACRGIGGFCGVGEVTLGLMVGAGLGLAGCAYQLTTQLLPRLALEQ